MIRKVVKDTFYLLTSSIFSRIIQTITGLIIVKVLGPSNYGLLRIINYIPGLAKFGNLGFASVAKREVPHIRGQNLGYKEEKKVKNVAFSAHFIWSLVLSGIIFSISFFYDNDVIKYGLWIVSLTLFSTSIRMIYNIILSVDKRFKNLAFINLLSVFISSLIVLTTIYWGGIFSVLIGGLVSSIISLIILAKFINLDFNFSFNKKELIRQIKIGLPLSGGTIAFGIFGWTQRGIIISLFGSEILGIYMLLIFMSEGVMIFLNNFLRSITIDLYERLGKKELDESTKNLILKPSVFIGLVFPIIGGIVWIFMPNIVSIYLPDYKSIIPIISFIILITTFESTSAMVRTAMNSARLNMQVEFMFLYLISAVTFVLLVYIFKDYSTPILILGLSRTICSLILFLGGFILTRKYFTDSIIDLIIKIISITFPMIFIYITISLINKFMITTSLLDNFAQMIVFGILIIPLIYFYSRRLNLGRIMLKIFNKKV